MRLTDIETQLIAETAQAIGVSGTGERDDLVWLPKSKIEFEDAPKQAKGPGRTVAVTLPEWLARDKGLI